MLLTLLQNLKHMLGLPYGGGAGGPLDMGEESFGNEDNKRRHPNTVRESLLQSFDISTKELEASQQVSRETLRYNEDDDIEALLFLVF